MQLTHSYVLNARPFIYNMIICTCRPGQSLLWRFGCPIYIKKRTAWIYNFLSFSQKLCTLLHKPRVGLDLSRCNLEWPSAYLTVIFRHQRGDVVNAVIIEGGLRDEKTADPCTRPTLDVRVYVFLFFPPLFSILTSLRSVRLLTQIHYFFHNLGPLWLKPMTEHHSSCRLPAPTKQSAPPRICTYVYVVRLAVWDTCRVDRFRRDCKRV